jgi:hypothetical protein
MWTAGIAPGSIRIITPPGAGPSARSPDSPPEIPSITWGWLRGILGTFAGSAVAALGVALELACERAGVRSKLPAAFGGASIIFQMLPAVLPGAGAALAICGPSRCSPWRRSLAAIGAGLATGSALALAFLVLIGFQAHADWDGYVVGCGIVFALAGALSAVSLLPGLRPGSVRAALELVLSGAAAFSLGGLAHGVILRAAASVPGPMAALILPVGFAVALACAWGGLGAGVELVLARARRRQQGSGGGDREVE